MTWWFLPVSLQPTGMPPGPLWSSQRCHASQASSPGSCPSLTSPPSKGSTARLLQESCFLSPVSLVPTELTYIYTYCYISCRWQSPLCLPRSFLCSAGYGHLHWSDSQLLGETLWWLALLLVLHTGLGGYAHDLLCRWERTKAEGQPFSTNTTSLSLSSY